MKPVKPIKLQRRVMPTLIVSADFVGVSPHVAPKFNIAELRRRYQDRK